MNKGKYAAEHYGDCNYDAAPEANQQRAGTGPLVLPGISLHACVCSHSESIFPIYYNAIGGRFVRAINRAAGGR
jgi:hypothetical protein